MDFFKRLKIRFLPPSSRSFHKIMAELRMQLQQIEMQQDCIMEKLEINQKNLVHQSVEQRIEENLQQVAADVKRISSLLTFDKSGTSWVDYEREIRDIEKVVVTAFMNQKAFSSYKNKYDGKSIVVCGAGPSLNYYEPIQDAVHIALNRAFLFEPVDFDYVFCSDFRGIKHISEELKNYQGKNCVKFFGLANNWEVGEIPEDYVIACNGIRFSGGPWLGENENFEVDISTYGLRHWPGTVFRAIQFAMYTHPAKLYLVGCDSTNNGHFNNLNLNNVEAESIDASLKDFVNPEIGVAECWLKFKNFAKLYYPDTEIISINPIGLKGLFKDVYSESYLAQI